MINIDGIEVLRICASQMSTLTLGHEKDDKQPQLFTVEPVKHSFTAEVPIPKSLWTVKNGRGKQTESVHMAAIQILIICNDATTGHKLQGCTVKNMFVHAMRNVQKLGLCCVLPCDNNEWFAFEQKL